MFSRPLFRPSFFSNSWFDDPFEDEWNELLRQQWQEQQQFQQQRQRARTQPQPQQPQPQQRIKATIEEKQPQQQAANMEQKYADNNNNNSNNSNNSQLVNRPSSSTGTVARPRSFWDLTSFPSWSGLTPQSIRLEWSGTESSAKEYVVSAYLPDGMTAGDVNISMDERTRMLTLTCKQRTHEEEKDQDGHIISSRSATSHVERAIQLPHDGDVAGLSASQGQASGSAGSSPQLVLHLPKHATPQPQPGVKQITIR